MQEAKQVVRTGEFELPFAPESVMPLFTPEGHRKWVEGWDAKPVYPAGAIEYFPNSVFVTRTSENPVVWTILEATKDYAEYIHTMGASAVGRIRVEVAKTDSGSRVSARFIVTALDARGESVINDHFTKTAFEQKLANWQKRLRAVLS